MANPDFSPLNLSPPPTSHTPITHPTLGPLTGTLRSPSVVQFRSIPYARIPARFRQSVPISTLEPEERDCTEYGPACPQNLQSMDALGGMLEGEKAVWFDEGRCLGLTVTGPGAGLEGRGPGRGAPGVPVMVHVHGGAFVEGSHTLGVRGMFIF
jgi:carboxylesterase type B